MSIFVDAARFISVYSSSKRPRLSFLAAAALLAAPAAASAQNPGMPPVTPAAAANGALVCRGLPDDDEAAAGRLVALGWNRHPMSGAADGQSRSIFERDGILVTISPVENGRSCMVAAMLASSVRGADLVAAATAAFGHPPEAGASDRVARWQLDGRYRVTLIHSRDPASVIFLISPVRNPQ